MTQLELAFLGPPRIEYRGKPVSLDTRKAVALLAFLAVEGEAQTRDGLAALLWPESDRSHGRAALRRTLWALKRAFDGEGLTVDRESVGLDIDAGVDIDTTRVRALLDGCATHGHSTLEVCASCIEPLTQAADCYRGEFLDGFTLRDSPVFDDWLQSQTEASRRELIGILDRAIKYARRCLALDPMNEAMHRRLMLVYSWARQRPAALRQYRDCVRVLDRELGVPPLEETTQLYHAIREDRVPAPPRARGDEAVIVTTDATDRKRAPVVVVPGRPTYPLVGRDTEWDALVQAYSTVGPDGHLIVLEGEAGVGKTRLAEEFLAHVEGAGANTVSARCFQGEDRLPYGLFVEALRSATSGPDSTQARLTSISELQLNEVARLLPEIVGDRPGLPTPSPLDSPGAQSRYFEAVALVLQELCRGVTPGVLFLDDLHWADEASISLLTYLVRRLEGRPLCVLATWRGGGAGDGPRSMVSEARRAGLATTVSLSRLSISAVEELVRAADVPGLGISEERAEQLYLATEGLPFFLVEYLASLSEALSDEADSATSEWTVPASVRDLVRSRVASVSETGRQLLDTASVIGRAFELDIVQRASGRTDDETVAAMDELVSHGLVQEESGAEGGSLSYDFSHQQIRSLVYEETSLARRRLLHRRVAEAIESRFKGRRDHGRHAGSTARHYRIAGRDSEAAVYFKVAGDHAKGLFANAEALDHYRNALLLGHEDVAAVNESIGDQLTLLGEYRGAIESYETAASLGGTDLLPRLEGKLGTVYIRRGDWELAESHVQAAVAGLGEFGSASQRSRLYADWALIAHRRGDAPRAARLAGEAATLATDPEDTEALAQAHNVLGILSRNGGDLDAAVQHLERSLDLARTLSDPSVRVAALNNLALARGAIGDIETAIDLARSALELCASQGDRHREAAIHNNLADLHHAANRPEDAMSHLEQAVTMFAEIGEDLESESLEFREPEIWKLVEW